MNVYCLPFAKNSLMDFKIINRFVQFYENFSSRLITVPIFFSSPELAQGELLGYRNVRRPSYVWTSVTSETSVRQLFSLCTL